MSWPPICPGMATVPAPGLAAPRTVNVLLAMKKPRTHPTPIASTVNATLRIAFPPEITPRRMARQPIRPHKPVDDTTAERVSHRLRAPVRRLLRPNETGLRQSDGVH